MRRAILFAVSLTACSSANTNEAEFWTPSAAAAQTTPTSDASTPAADTGVVTPGNCLHIEFTTHEQNGRYAPEHVEAVWIVDGAGKFVRTLAVYGYIRTRYLLNWHAAAGASGNEVDAITAATLRSYGAQAFDWDCTDANKQTVAPGNYTVFAEFAESDVRSLSASGPVLSVPFTLGGPQTLMPADVRGYSNALVKVN